MKFYCKECKVELTRELSALTERRLLRNEPGEDFIPEGFFLLQAPADEDADAAGMGRDVVINLKDLINVMTHPDPSRNTGCCRLDGSSGFNKLCINAHEIGTESSDCWMSHEFTLDASRVQGRALKTYALSAYKLDVGQPLIEFVRGLHLCDDTHLLGHIQAGAVEIDGLVLRDAAKIIKRDTIKNGSVLRCLDQEVSFQLWLDEDGLR